METIAVVIKDEFGLHAKPAFRLAQLANNFKSELVIENNERRVNGKSVLEILTLSAIKGSKIRLVITGEDEKDAAEGLKKLLDDSLGRCNDKK
jgi:phosphocarrier protein